MPISTGSIRPDGITLECRPSGVAPMTGARHRSIIPGSRRHSIGHCAGRGRFWAMSAGAEPVGARRRSSPQRGGWHHTPSRSPALFDACESGELLAGPSLPSREAHYGESNRDECIGRWFRHGRERDGRHVRIAAIAAIPDNDLRGGRFPACRLIECPAIPEPTPFEVCRAGVRPGRLSP